MMFLSWVFFFKQKTAYDMRISDWSSDVCSSDLWPGEDRMRRLAETGINPNSYDPGQVVAFFARFPPRTATGNARHALALMQQGRMGEARKIGRAACRERVCQYV